MHAWFLHLKKTVVHVFFDSFFSGTFLWVNDTSYSKSVYLSARNTLVQLLAL